ncbi:TPA: hypothetical protein O2C02_002933 [Staphylococcus aureus]|uniref:hypothetical protein n=3 Tax=Staphylococcus aureus TaxID=1280 RepID=UPI0005E166FC|nr:hypothetical protein [Staphylococcus aureus]MBD6796949.1 hypothetical protein [Staphylococcus aureus]MCQ1135588.1 hypothetical protein [Staphylococcus aureus]QHK36033.1 hypothetical protein E3T14_14580 [Staphylococcus aureus]UCJ68013.1 hypothetical protein KU512_13075 [Staphylococcus aureus]UCJ71021.1 hypothetical protein KU513_14665 [Staphylococcus aureus]
MKLYNFLYNLHYNPGEAITSTYKIGDTIDRNNEGFFKGDGIDCLKTSNSLLKSIVSSYGDLYFNRIQTNDSPLIFSRKLTPSGGGLYPINLFLLIEYKGNNVLWQFDFKRNLLIYIKKINTLQNLQTPLIVLVPCYTRNFFKYKEFSYRLCPIDSGYLATTLSYNLLLHNIDHNINIDSDTLQKTAPIFQKAGIKEKPLAIIKLFEKFTLDEIEVQKFDEVKNYHFFNEVQKFDNIDKLINKNTFPKLEIRKKMFNNSKINNSLFPNRISPGGEFIQNSFVEFEDISNLFFNFHSIISKIHIDPKIFKISLIDTSNNNQYFYNYEFKLRFQKKVNVHFINKQLTRQNFDLQTTPFILHVGIDEGYLQNYFANTPFKISRFLGGGISALIALLGLKEELYFHPMMSYNALNLETYLFDNKYKVVNQIAIGKKVVLNRLASSINTNLM